MSRRGAIVNVLTLLLLSCDWFSAGFVKSFAPLQDKMPAVLVYLAGSRGDTRLELNQKFSSIEAAGFSWGTANKGVRFWRNVKSCQWEIDSSWVSATKNCFSLNMDLATSKSTPLKVQFVTMATKRESPISVFALLLPFFNFPLFAIGRLLRLILLKRRLNFSRDSAQVTVW